MSIQRLMYSYIRERGEIQLSHSAPESIRLNISLPGETVFLCQEPGGSWPKLGGLFPYRIVV